MKEITRTDTDKFLTLLEEARKYKLSIGDYAWGDYPFTKEDVELRLKRGGNYLAYVDNKVTGSIALTWDDEHNWNKRGTDQQAGYIHSLMVGDGFRGQKIGEQMIAWALKQIVLNDRHLARLDCPAINKELCSYYEKLGFKCVNTKGNSRLYELAL